MLLSSIGRLTAMQQPPARSLIAKSLAGHAASDLGELITTVVRANRLRVGGNSASGSALGSVSVWKEEKRKCCNFEGAPRLGQ
jgi:hypothetical protein